MKTEYDIVQKYSIEDLKSEVNRLSSLGWVPHGSPQIFQICNVISYAQAIIRNSGGPLLMTPAEKWEALRLEILLKIDEIDKETPWEEVEPKWWLRMMDVARAARGLRPVSF